MGRVIIVYGHEVEDVYKKAVWGFLVRNSHFIDFFVIDNDIDSKHYINFIDFYENFNRIEFEAENFEEKSKCSFVRYNFN